MLIEKRTLFKKNINNVMEQKHYSDKLNAAVLCALDEGFELTSVVHDEITLTRSPCLTEEETLSLIKKLIRSMC